SRLVDLVENAEVVPEEQFIGNIQVWLAGHSRKVVMPASKLAERGVDDVIAELRGQRTDQRLIANKHVVSAAGCADAAAIQSCADELVQIPPIFDVVPNCKLMAIA